MNFSDVKIGFFILVVLMLNACANMAVVEDQAKSQSELVQPTELAPQLTPFEQKIVELKAQPNHYVLNQPSATANMRHEYNQALDAKRNKEYPQAINLLTQMTQSYPQLSGPWLQLGDIALGNESDQSAALSKAYSHYQQAVLVNPHNYLARNRLARVLRIQGRFDQAEAEYKKAIDSWPAFASSYKNLGILYDLYLGDKQAALDNYQIYQALQDKPERKVRGWIADVSRQISSQKRNQLAQENQ